VDNTLDLRLTKYEAMRLWSVLDKVVVGHPLELTKDEAEAVRWVRNRLATQTATLIEGS
jgi:hypothetical protein